MSLLAITKSSIRILATGQLRKIWTRRYEGDAAGVCRQIVERCYDRRREYFRTSADTYAELWTRDFGRCVPALLNCGYHEEVHKSYVFAFRAFHRAGRFALAIQPDGATYNFPFGTYSPDGFAFFLYGLCALGDGDLVKKHRSFLYQEALRFYHATVDPYLGTVLQNVHFSEAQDYLQRNASCYTATCCFIVQKALARLHIDTPLERFEYPSILKREYYSPKLGYFFDDMEKRTHVSGDANILPFWSGAMEGQTDVSWPTVLSHLDAARLHTPVPTRYRNGSESLPSLRLARLNPWQNKSVWTCLGIHFLETLYAHDRVRFDAELKRMKSVVETLHCFPEVIDSDNGRLYANWGYVAETSMIWAASLLNLLQTSPRVAYEHLE